MTGEPIPRAMVSLGGADGAGAATDATGHWSISNATCSGNRVVNASRIGFINSNMFRANSGSRPSTVNLVSGSPVSGVKVSLMPESSIAGKVLDQNNDPVESARIQAVRVQVQAGQRMLVNVGASATDSQGNFRIGGLQPGRYVICAGSSQLTYPVGGGAAMAYRDDCYPGPVTSGLSIAMPVEAGSEVRTTFTLNPMPGVHVRGHVSGLPATAVRSNVQLIAVPRNLAMGQNLNAQVQTDGSFEIATVPPGSYVAMVNWQSNPPGPQPACRRRSMWAIPMWIMCRSRSSLEAR
jgi:Carboxypeptidase regulatory-like domain